MIFAIETEERTLIAFTGEAEAVAYCEGLDVEAAIWCFWSDSGDPLEAEFSAPNKRGVFGSSNGTYSLVPASPNHHAHLLEALDEVLTFESAAPFNSAQSVRAYLENTNA